MHISALHTQRGAQTVTPGSGAVLPALSRPARPGSRRLSEQHGSQTETPNL